MIEISKDWKDYECICSGDGEKVDRFKDVILRRPDPQSIWPKSNNIAWKQYDGIYYRSNTGGGHWEFKRKLKDSWTINYKDLTFKVAPTNFKHTGIFPEQACNWDYVAKKIKDSKRDDLNILNLFAYTGCATMAASKAGASQVVHVDASKGMNEWAKENMHLCKLDDHKIRFIQDDCLKFLEKEKRRGHKYHGVIMDPPSYGRGPNGEVWRFEDNLKQLLTAVRDILADDFCFVLINSYTTGTSPTSLNNILKIMMPNTKIKTGEIGLPITENNLVLPCGIYGRITKD